jgi:hypothetical protein
MARLRNEENPGSAPGDDDLGQLIRWSLQDSVAKAEPRAEVWLKIRDRVSQTSAPAVSQQPRRRLPVASLVQAVVISSLVLAFGFGVERDVVTYNRQTRTTPAPVVRPEVSYEMPDDLLSGHLLSQMERELAPSGRVGGNAR